MFQCASNSRRPAATAPATRPAYFGHNRSLAVTSKSARRRTMPELPIVTEVIQCCGICNAS